MKQLSILLIFLFAQFNLVAQEEHLAWADSVYQTLSLKERIGQLMMMRAHSNLGPDHQKLVESFIDDYAVGGLCFFQGTPEKQAELTNLYQSKSKIPLMISMDAEWGLGMRLKENSISFPRQLTLGAIQDNRQIYDMGVEIARQLKRLGVHVNFAPVVDINNNPDNPVINNRSFGEDRFQVSTKSYLYAKGMEDNGVMACAKHFPGHGDTDVDSHYDLPVISHDRNRLDSIELLPFKILAEKGIQGMMVAHLHVPSIDPTTNKPTTLSRAAVNDLLINELNFKGLIFTDGLGMKGVTKHWGEGEVEAEALLAGNDVLLLPQDIKASFAAILSYLKDGRISENRLENAVKKVLAAKYELGLRTKQAPIQMANLRSDLNSQKAETIKQALYEKALTLVRDDANLVPFQNISALNAASLSLGSSTQTVFQNRLQQFKSMEHYQMPRPISADAQSKMLTKLMKKDVVFVGIHDMSRLASKNFGISSEELGLLASLNQRTKVVLVLFGSPYSLRYFDLFPEVMVAYEEDALCQDVAAQALFGAIPINGLLPVTASPRAPIRTGLQRASLQRIGYASPESVGMSGMVLSKIDALAAEAIEKKATPGCVVLVAKDGKIIFEKGYGHHTYANKKKVNANDIYDLASVTKILSGTLSTMKLSEQGIVDINAPLYKNLSDSKGTNKANLKLKDIMAHHARLKSWIKFYEATLSEKGYPIMEEYYQKRSAVGCSMPVTESLYLKNNYRDTLERKIFDSPLGEEVKYVYSDLGFYLVADMVREKAKMGIDEYTYQTFYAPMGLADIGYNPWKFSSLNRVPPTEVDKYFRRQTVWGYVHDMGAAMLGGVSGHAGLFGSAKNIAEIMQMFLNEGYYAGEQYLRPETIKAFTQRHPASTRRAIGFDMKELDAKKSQNMCSSASEQTFGHLGFTGTATWADPKHNLIYVFLANRTYPTMYNTKLNKEDFRPRIQEILYEALLKDPS